MMNKKNNVVNKVKMLYGENISFSFPVPATENDMKVEKYFVYRMSFEKNKTRPFAKVITAFADGTILEIVNSHFNDFVDTSDYPFEKKISYELSDNSLTARQMKELIERANSLYNTVREIFFQKELSENDKAIVIEYKAIIDRITPPSLIPFYNALNPLYVSWLNSVI